MKYFYAAIVAYLGLATIVDPATSLAPEHVPGQGSRVVRSLPLNPSPQKTDSPLQEGTNTEHSPTSTTAKSGTILTLTLSDALVRAKAMSPTLERALENVKIAHEDKVQTRALNLPTVSANSQFLYTQGNGTAAGRFIANNGVHEYIAQGDVHQVLSMTQVVQYRHSVVMEVLARDQAAVAERDCWSRWCRVTLR
ncbi:MAG: outer rane efflux protein [Edaphobacter sp.]|nr:outer rane efflux protein [Edaphobacter sp.]